MSVATPWSVKGIDPKAREVAKDLARRSGMTLGEWLNRMILDDEGPEDAVSEADIARRPAPLYFESARRTEDAPARVEAAEHPADEMGRIALALDRLSERLEVSESRTGLAVSGVEHSVRAALARIEAAEREHIAVAARFEGAVEGVASEQTRMAERLRRMEAEAAGPRSAEALRALEGAVAKVANHLYDGETRTREALGAIEARVDRVEAQGGSESPGLIEEVVGRVSQRLSEAETRTAEALESLRESFAHLDGRIQSVEAGEAPAIDRRLEEMAARLTERVEASRVEMTQKLHAAADGRFDRMERRLGEMTNHVRAAEQRSAQAIEAMGREVLSMAENLNRRVQTAEHHSAQAIQTVGGEVARIATAMETRLGRSDSLHAEALERLGGEIAKITERLGERIATAERRSAQAIDDVGDQVARVTERISSRQDRAAEELSERIRLSEERTARLLEEARERIDRRLAEAPAARETAPAPMISPEPDPVENSPFGLEDFAGFEATERSAEPLARQAFAAVADDFPSARVFGPEADRPPLSPEDFEAADGFDPPPKPRPRAAEPEPVLPAEPYMAEPVEPPPRSVAERVDPAPKVRADYEDDFGFEDESEFVAEPAPAQRAVSAQALSTREVIAQARAAARAAPAAEAKGRKTKGKAKPAPEPKESGSLFSGFSMRPKKRASSTLQTALLISGGAAFLGMAAGGMMLIGGEPAGDLPARVAQAVSAGRNAPEELAGLETEGGMPRAAIALSPQPALEGDDPGPSAQMREDFPELYAEAVRQVESGAAGGVDELKRVANLGYAPAQFYLAKLHETGGSGVAKDMVEARRWTERAAQGGDRKAMHNLALYYFEGVGGAKNSTTAAQWFRRAADLGLVDSQYNLGRLYEEGFGVSQNAAEAYKWFMIAGAAGDKDAAASAERIKGALTPAAQAVAERAAAAFRPTEPAAPIAAAASGVTPTTLQTAQRALSRLGYYQGPTDGAASPALRLAVAAYQRDQGMAATGVLDQTTVSKLSVFTR
ncbi:MAG: peptidoglycan-binding protein [Phenylobacterium sp.]|uniref:SEL1-like repeat protein n=1 Tax=Phenylobacterium sp. TaxID=1871053 RepID=UPI00271DAFF9|nr:peptidoglycan-binding protein [Phenylobacterium sp.]MDO8901576.1 peptidoglycan-binding protein [Phenylobacterium sp.]